MKRAICVAIGFLMVAPHACTRPSPAHWWYSKKADNATGVYGEIAVLATQHATYYCGANGHPGETAGGHCGTQRNGPKDKRTMFSIWEISAKLHPRVSRADLKSIFNRFGGEGEGAQAHMLWDWQLGDTIQFSATKRLGGDLTTTDTLYYTFDREAIFWRHSATFNIPIGDRQYETSAKAIGVGGMPSLLENYTGQDDNIPKVALFRLRPSTKTIDLKSLIQASDYGAWCKVHDC